MAFGDYQFEIYLQGLAGVVPGLPMTFTELQERAGAAMSPSVWSYVAGGAGDEHTQRANVAAFRRWGLVPRMFVGADERDLAVDLFGVRWPAPVFMAPIGVAGICAQDGHGDLACARAAAATGVPLAVSTLTADPLEDVAAQLGDAPGFFQLYTPKDRDLAASLVAGAASGLQAAGASSPPTPPRGPAGGRGIWPPPTFRSCGATAWPTTPPTRCFAPAWRSRPRRIRRPPCWPGCRPSETR